MSNFRCCILGFSDEVYTKGLKRILLIRAHWAVLFKHTLPIFNLCLSSLSFSPSSSPHPAASPLAFPSLFSVYRPFFSTPATSFLLSLSAAAFPFLPSQPASRCCLRGLVMVTMATGCKWWVAQSTSLGGWEI